MKLPRFRSSKKDKSEKAAVSAKEEMKGILERTEEDRKEIQELNEQFQNYLDRVRELDERNRELNLKIDELKRQWGFEQAPEKDKVDSELERLRADIDENAKEKIELELRAKRAEYDIYSYLKGINILEVDGNAFENKQMELEAKLDATAAELENLTEQIGDSPPDYKEAEAELKRLMDKLEALKNQYDAESLQRVQLQNDLQTLEEKLGFLKAIYEERLNDMRKITSIQIDSTGFYKVELGKAIAAIRADFNKLREAQKAELEDLYGAKINEVTRKAEEKKKQLESAGEGKETPAAEMDLSELQDALRNLQKERDEIMRDHSHNEAEYQNLLMRYQELNRTFEEAEMQQLAEINYLRAGIAELEQAIRAILDGNISLRFEINTYRKLLEIEQQRLDSPDKGIKMTSRTRMEPIRNTIGSRFRK